MDVFVARQPILDENENIFAYELLYRDSPNNFFNTDYTDDKVTSILLTNSYFNIGMEQLIEGKKAFINFDEILIKKEIPLMFPPESIVVEILETVVPDRDLIRKLRALKAKGYTIALDDFTVGYDFQTLIDLADIIKVDFMLNTKEDIINIILKHRNHTRKFLAEKVEDRETYLFAKDLGFSYYQGYFFSKPKLIKGREISIGELAYFDIFKEMDKPEPEIPKISKIIERDIALTYKLLKLVNSKFGLANEVTSIKHALAILGLAGIQKWLTLLMVSDISKGQNADIAKMAMFRSRFAELVAKNTDGLRLKADEVSLMGLVSLVDVLLNRPLDGVIKELPLSRDIKNALLNQSGPFNVIYKVIKAYEQGLWKEIYEIAEELKLDVLKLQNLYISAVTWTDELFVYIENKEYEQA